MSMGEVCPRVNLCLSQTCLFLSRSLLTLFGLGGVGDARGGPHAASRRAKKKNRNRGSSVLAVLSVPLWFAPRSFRCRYGLMSVE